MPHVFGRISPEEWKRLGWHALALSAVAAAALTRTLIGATAPSTAFLLFNAAVAVSAAAGGVSPGAVAILGSIALARIAGEAPWSACLLFAVESGVVVYVVVELAGALAQYRGWLDAAEQSVRDLRAVERRGRVVHTAFTHLQEASDNRVVVLLDRDGRIAEWTEGPSRLYDAGAERVLGTTAAALFDPELDQAEFSQLLADARAGAVARRSGTHRRSDGSAFDADVEIRWLSNLGADGFTLLIHDLSGRRASEAFARRAEEMQAALRAEANVAQQQLASLQSVTDPYLNALTGHDATAALLDRLQTAVNADGIALVQIGGSRPRLFWAAEGVQPQPIGLVHSDTSAQRLDRTVLIHNDAARVAETSAVRWPAGVLSLICVPVLRGGQTTAVIEVAYLRGRRSTEWEIALIQVAAARAAGLLRDGALAETGAVA